MLEHWPQGLQIGFPNSFSFFFVFFKALGPRQGRKVQHLLVTWGRLKRFFWNISALKMPNGKPLGMIFQLLHQ